MAKEKIKVEADITIKKNVVSGIGKGFGLVIGIFLALVIAVSCSIMLSSNATKVGEKTNEAQTINQLDDNSPYGQGIKEADEVFKFNPNSMVESRNGVSLSIDNVKYEIKGEDWGKLTEVTFTILNEMHTSFSPKVYIALWDGGDKEDEWYRADANVEFDIYSLNKGEHITQSAITDIGFNNLNLTKSLRLVLVDSYDFLENKPIVFIKKEFNVTAKQ